MAKKKQILFQPGFPNPVGGTATRWTTANDSHKFMDIFLTLDMIAHLARRRAYGNEGKGNQMDAQGTGL
jgi:hypothetical protein